MLISSTDAENNFITYDYYSAGLPRQITSPGDAITTMQYNLQGNQTQLVEPNAGPYNYTYNAFGELLTQDENGKTTTLTYDRLGRPLTVTEQEGTTTYQYDTKPNGKGMIASVTGPGGASEDYTYDEYSRLSTKTESIDSYNFTESLTYDNYGRLSRLTYPSGFAVTYHYNNYHYLSEIKRADNQDMIWKIEEMDERLQVEQFRSGNNLVTTQSFELDFITGIQTGSIQNLQYNWNMETGNLNWRKDVNRNLKENFTYDTLNRLTSASIEGGATMNFSYSANGNFESTTPAGTYSYESARPHAVTSVTNPNNLISTADQVVEYTSFNKVKKITEGIYDLRIFYGVDKQRRKIEKRDDETLLLERYYAHFNYEKDIENGTVTERHYILGGTGLVAIFEKVGANETMYYIHKDHLGSINCITDQSGALVGEEMSFDAWGRRRNPEDWTYDNLPASYLFDRGYTGHEHLDEFALINMNGRVYDPIVGRFLSPDIMVQKPEHTQSYNRYSFAMNNPLKFTDPSGYMAGGERCSWYTDGAGMEPDEYPVYTQLSTGWQMAISGGRVPINYGGPEYYHVGGGEWINKKGESVTWNDIYNNEVLPNASLTYYGEAAQLYFETLVIKYSSSEFKTMVRFPGYDNHLFQYENGVFYLPWTDIEVDPLDVLLSENIASAGGGGWYNSFVARAIVPDFISVGVGFTGIAGVGAGSSIEFRWVTRGPEASWKPMVTITQSAGGGFQIDATLNLETANYIGSVNNIARSMMQTSTLNGDFPTIWGAGGATAGGKIGATLYVTPNVRGYLILGREVNLGVGLPAGPLPANGSGGASNTWILYDFYY